MNAFRHMLAQCYFAILLCAAALLLKVLVPGGYMVDIDHGRPFIGFCSGTGAAMAPAVAHDPTPQPATPNNHKAEMPCAFAGLSAAAICATDPLQLAGLIAFVMAIGLVSVATPALGTATRLRPPLRGPPATG